jgi:hypothetical protein
LSAQPLSQLFIASAAFRGRSILEIIFGLAVLVVTVVFVVPRLEAWHRRTLKESAAEGVPVDARQAHLAASGYDAAWAIFLLGALAAGITGWDALASLGLACGALWLLAAQRIIRKPLEWPIVADAWAVRFFWIAGGRGSARRLGIEREGGYMRFVVATTALVLGIGALVVGVAGVGHAVGVVDRVPLIGS